MANGCHQHVSPFCSPRALFETYGLDVKIGLSILLLLSQKFSMRTMMMQDVPEACMHAWVSMERKRRALYGERGVKRTTRRMPACLLRLGFQGQIKRHVCR